MSKFQAGTQVWINSLTEDSDPSDSEEIWGTYKSAEIASVDAVNHKLTFVQDIGLNTND